MAAVHSSSPQNVLKLSIVNLWPGKCEIKTDRLLVCFILIVLGLLLCCKEHFVLGKIVIQVLWNLWNLCGLTLTPPLPRLCGEVLSVNF